MCMWIVWLFLPQVDRLNGARLPHMCIVHYNGLRIRVGGESEWGMNEWRVGPG